jgi:lambda repressor-like predicted transcriptional regulator
MNTGNLLTDPIEIKIALIRARKSQADIARDLGVDKAIVTRVIKSQRTSKRVRMAIAKAVRIPVEELWPQSNRKKPRNHVEFGARKAA